jgi:F-type H+-transporting ATPase subunit b
MTTPIRVVAGWSFAVALCLATPAARAQQPDPHAAAPAPAAGAEPAVQPPVTDPHATPPADQAAAPDGHAAPAADHAAPAGEHAADAEHAEGGHEGESIWAFLGRLFNFALLAGGLVYFLKTPIANYLASRSEQIRADLVNAAATRESATRELAAIDARMKGLPAELEALKTRGKEEIAAEQARIKAAADTERQRLVEQARLEIAQQTRAARRDLQEYAATLAVDVAKARLSAEMTDADQSRLVDRYVAQVKTAHE